MKFLIVPIVSPLLIWYYDVSVLMDDGKFMFYFVMCYGIGFPLIAWSYFLSFNFKNKISAFITIFMISFVAAFVLPITVFILQFFPSLKTWYEWIMLLSRIFLPPFLFGNSMFNMATISLVKYRYGLGSDDFLSVWDNRVNGENIKYMILQTIYFTIGIIIFENI
jgi:hypothetical protein